MPFFNRVILLLILIPGVLPGFCCSSGPLPEIRPSALAGRWYPATADRLAAQIDELLANAQSRETAEGALVFILPHAGYQYSGAVAAEGYSIIRKMDPDIIVILAPSHHVHLRGCVLDPVDFYETPLGRVKVDGEAVKALLKKEHFTANREAHRNEHAIEIHLPFLQRIFADRMGKGTGILPILVGHVPGSHFAATASDLAEVIKSRRRPLIIVSSDFTHYGPRFGYMPFRAKSRDDFLKKQKDYDMGAIDPILKMDRAGFDAYLERTGITVCGREPIRLAMALPLSVAGTKLLKYNTSCTISGECENSVSYAAIALWGAFTNGTSSSVQPGKAIDDAGMAELSAADRTFLLTLARDNIRSLLGRGKRHVIPVKGVPPACMARLGVFVTLKKRGELRGCIGSVSPSRPLYELVLENSGNAAFRDPRFSPLTAGELGDIRIEISVLSEPRPVNSIEEIFVGRDGLIIVMGERSGLLLPQVAAEEGWTREEYLMWLCRKAGLPDDAWRRGARLFSFRALVFSEERS